MCGQHGQRRTLELLLAERVLVAVKVEEAVGDGVCGWFVVWVVVRLEVGVAQGLLNRDALDGVEGEQAIEQIEGEVGRGGEELAPGNLLFKGQRAYVLARPSRLYAVVVLHCRGAEHIEDQSELMVVWRGQLLAVRQRGKWGKSVIVNHLQSLPGNSGLPLSI